MTSAYPQKARPTFVLNCSPSLGVLDSWISVLHSLKKTMPEADFIFVADPPDVVSEISRSALLPIAESIFNRIVFCAESGNWYHFDTFLSAVEMSKKLAVKSRVQGLLPKKFSQGFISDGLKNKLQKFVFTPAARVLESVRRSRQGRSKTYSFFEGLKLDPEMTVLLFDLHQVNSKNDFVSKFDGMPKFSLLHGIAVLGVGRASITPVQETINTENTVALAHSPADIKFYRHRYGLRESAIRVVGVPRHDPEWIDYLVDQQGGEEIPFKGKRFIFVISRHCNASYHPRERKITAIQDIQLAAEQHDLRIVVKLHPKEKPDGTYEQVLGEKARGVTWAYSNAHPFVLGKGCEFAVSFWSGIPADMIRLGVPSIERFDLRGLPGNDNESSLRDCNGEPVFAQRYLGLVLGSSDRKTFMAQVDEVMRRREQVVKQLQTAYTKYFPVIPAVNSVIAEEICKALASESLKH